MSAYSDAVLALNPTSYWRSLTDSGSAGLTLTGVNSPVSVPSIIPCEVGAADSAWLLDGTNYLHAGDNYDFIEVSFTLIIWVESRTTTHGSAFRRWFDKADGTTPFFGWRFYCSDPDNATFDWITSDGNDGFTEGDVDIQRNIPDMLGFTWNNATQTASVYYNGTMVGADSGFPFVIGSEGNGVNFCIGAAPDGGNGWIGILDDPAVWSGTILDSLDFEDLWAAANDLPEKQSFYFSRRRYVRV